MEPGSDVLRSLRCSSGITEQKSCELPEGIGDCLQPGEDGVDDLQDGRKYIDKTLSDGRFQRIELLGQNLRLVRPAVGGTGKISLCIRCNGQQIVVAEQSLFLLRHCIIGFRDTLCKGILFQVGNTQVNTKLFQRFRLARNTGTELSEGIIAGEIVERCHITGKASDLHGHCCRLFGGHAHRLEHSTHGGGILLCRQL